MTEPLSPAPADVVRQYWRNWSERRKSDCLALIDPNATYALYVPEETLPFGGVTSGRASISDRLQTILDVFDTLTFEGSISRAFDEMVQGHVAYRFRHKITGETIDGTMRQVIRVRNGLIVSWEEYTDVELVRAFMRLVAYSATE